MVEFGDAEQSLRVKRRRIAMRDANVAGRGRRARWPIWRRSAFRSRHRCRKIVHPGKAGPPRPGFCRFRSRFPARSRPDPAAGPISSGRDRAGNSAVFRHRCAVAGDTSGSCGGLLRPARRNLRRYPGNTRTSIHLILPAPVHSLRCSRDRDVTGGYARRRTVKIPACGAARRRGSPPPAVAKLQRARDTLVRLLIRGMDEHAAYRGRSPQQQGRG